MAIKSDDSCRTSHPVQSTCRDLLSALRLRTLTTFSRLAAAPPAPTPAPASPAGNPALAAPHHDAHRIQQQSPDADPVQAALPDTLLQCPAADGAPACDPCLTSRRVRVRVRIERRACVRDPLRLGRTSKPDAAKKRSVIAGFRIHPVRTRRAREKTGGAEQKSGESEDGMQGSTQPNSWQLRRA